MSFCKKYGAKLSLKKVLSFGAFLFLFFVFNENRLCFQWKQLKKDNPPLNIGKYIVFSSSIFVRMNCSVLYNLKLSLTALIVLFQVIFQHFKNITTSTLIHAFVLICFVNSDGFLARGCTWCVLPSVSKRSSVATDTLGSINQIYVP